MSQHDAETCAPTCPLATAGTRYVVEGGRESAVDRRTFLSQSLLAAAAAALAACGAAAGGGDITAPRSVGSSLNVASYSSLANTGGIAIVTMSGTRLAIVRTGASSFIALSLVCPHQGGSITTSGSGFLCTRHGAQFSATGTWLGGQRTTNMRSYPTQYDPATGMLTIG